MYGILYLHLVDFYGIGKYASRMASYGEKSSKLVNTKVVVSNMFYFHPHLGKIPNLTIFFRWVETTN